MLFLIDIVGTCNLRCPSCPVGNMSASFEGAPRPKGFMEFEHFKAVVEKIRAECGESGEPFKIALYNWGEALIHPRIADIVGHLHQEGIRFDISSNFHNHTDLWPIVQAMPDLLRISLSGGTNPTYQKNHVGGDINLVISNMYRLRHLMDKAKRLNPAHQLQVQVYYHLYKDNCDDDIARIYNLCAELNFQFTPGIAYLMPLEKMIYGFFPNDKFSAADQATLDRMYVSLHEAYALANLHKSSRCTLLEDQVVINHDGSVPVCCGVYDPVFQVEKDFLQTTLAELQVKRRKSPLCKVCMEGGIHNIAIRHPHTGWNELVRKKQLEIGTKYLTNVLEPPILQINPNARS